ncbi:ABC transporter ATP-binding protein [Chryseobacterium gallinarum]|uniref:ABC transporter ATP-binding protein n=1 Tax=Chryseobacterium gallinarum TaxID=1324352 RepID=A0A0G3M6C1_CHRGL|nr:peptidase domain-containing ABC transporter [Chryseobacterium gallinarum]AKK72572.1 ABC transporter ATP-binding protein [Chryseobacterium gallinarum]
MIGLNNYDKFPFYKQIDSKDCGPTCIRIVSKYYGKDVSLSQLRKLAQTTREGSSLLNLSEACEKIGYRTIGVRTDFDTLVEDVPLPAIVMWNKNHFVVVYKIEKKRKDTLVYVSDPGFGLVKFKKDEFLRHWIGNNADEKTREGIVLTLEPSPSFFANKFDDENIEAGNNKINLKFIIAYLAKYKKLIFHLLLGLFISSVITLIVPFLTQSIVDIGIAQNNINFIYLILLAQISLYIGRVSSLAIREWIFLHLSTRINLSVISDFFIKLMKLPISYFDSRMTGDLMQRINDHERIEKLLTNNSLNTIFSLFNLIVFSIVLLYYNVTLFFIFAIGSFLYFSWIFFFLKKRKILDYKRFSQISQEQSTVIELINGMQEIKMHNAERQKRWGWEKMQISLFKINLKALSLEQWQSIGGDFINQLKDLTLTFFSAKLVIDGQITLGAMLSIQFIIGQLNNPLIMIINFIKQFQDADIAIERLNEIHNKDNEENKIYSSFENGDIKLNEVAFKYNGTNEYIFNGLNIRIPYKKTTAIVGTSGSGKTTLLKLLLQFYPPNQGSITLNETPFENISPSRWRSECGVVMQDGYIFNDTIANNIALGEADHISMERLWQAINIANIDEFIESLPLGLNTKIGSEGMGISGGQKQRILIARAVYKSPKYIFFDEATSALDANNEKKIIENLESFFKDKTAIIVAHRLSTVKHADKIIVMEDGEVEEEGTHNELVEKKGKYYQLVKNQLELGN